VVNSEKIPGEPIVNAGCKTRGPPLGVETRAFKSQTEGLAP